MDSMDNANCPAMECADIRTVVETTFLLKVVNLPIPQKKLVNKLLEASDQLQDIVDMILSSTDTTIDLVQKILRAKTEELNLLQKVTDLNSKDWNLLRGFIYLCGGKRYFICKFMDWFLSDESLDVSCVCSGTGGVERVGKDGACGVEKGNDTVLSSCASQQGKSSTSVEALGKSCGENVLPVSETETLGKNGIVSREGNIAESCVSSAENRPEDSVQPTVVVKDVLSHEPVPSGSSELPEGVCGTSLSETEHNDPGIQLENAADKGNCILPVPVTHSTLNAQGSLAESDKQVLLNTKCAESTCENMEVGQQGTLVVRLDQNCHPKGMKESVQESASVCVKLASKMCLPPKQNVDTEVQEKLMKTESLQDSGLEVLTSPLSAVESTGMGSQNDIPNGSCLPVRYGSENRLDVSGRLCGKPSEEFVLKDCYVRLVDVGHMLRGKKTVSSEDLEGVQGIRIEKNIVENESSHINDYQVKGSSNMSVNTERKENVRQRCYINNAKKRKVQTCEDRDPQNVKRRRSTRLKCYTNRAKKKEQSSSALGPQDAGVKEKLLVGGHSGFEDLGQDKGNTSPGFSVNTDSSNNQDLSVKDLSTVQCAGSDVMPEVTEVAEGYRRQHRVPERQAQGFMCGTKGSNRSVGNVQSEGALFVGQVAFHEGSASEFVDRGSSMRIRVKPEFSERSGMLWGPLFREGKNGVRGKESVLGIQLQPYSMAQVGSLKWAQFTTYIDHPYSAGRHCHG